MLGIQERHARAVLGKPWIRTVDEGIGGGIAIVPAGSVGRRWRKRDLVALDGIGLAIVRGERNQAAVTNDHAAAALDRGQVNHKQEVIRQGVAGRAFDHAESCLDNQRHILAQLVHSVFDQLLVILRNAVALRHGCLEPLDQKGQANTRWLGGGWRPCATATTH